MRRVLVITAAILVVGGAIWAAEDITNTKHNLSTTSGNTITDDTETRICVFCHTPHHAAPSAPLWNHTLPSQTYQEYDSTVSVTMDMVVDVNGATGVSLMCLSCHDGSVAIGSMLNFGNAGSLAATQLTNASSAFLGTDLTSEHPVGILYDTAQDAAFNAAGTQTSAVLYSNDGGTTNFVECGSCHNPHEATLTNFQRVDNTGSVLCLDCHVK